MTETVATPETDDLARHASKMAKKKAARDKIMAGKGTPADLEMLASLSDTIRMTSLCGLGQTAPNPVLTTLRYFRDEYEALIRTEGA